MHEFGHVLGMQHTQQRSDREENVRINWDNMSPGNEFQFELSNDPLCGCYGMSSYLFINI